VPGSVVGRASKHNVAGPHSEPDKFPPFWVGEIGRVGSPKRHEIGHGRLAKRGVLAVMPGI